VNESEKMQIEAALKQAYLHGFSDARYYPNRREPKGLHVNWHGNPTVSADWNVGLPDPFYLVDTKAPGDRP
jgi:hypothetical protein